MLWKKHLLNSQAGKVQLVLRLPQLVEKPKIALLFAVPILFFYGVKKQQKIHIEIREHNVFWKLK